MQDRLNDIETCAYERLINEKGYSSEQIKRGKVGEPDFCCIDGKRFEVKLLQKNKLIFTDRQLETFLSSDIILVYSKKGLIAEFLWSERKKQSFFFVKEKCSQITLNEDLMEKVRYIVKKYPYEYASSKHFCDMAVKQRLDMIYKREERGGE